MGLKHSMREREASSQQASRRYFCPHHDGIAGGMIDTKMKASIVLSGSMISNQSQVKTHLLARLSQCLCLTSPIFGSLSLKPPRTLVNSITGVHPNNKPSITNMASDSITAIKESLPPTTDYLTYLTILESHLSPQILPTLYDILQDAELCQNIGWDLVNLLLPLPGSEKCLTTIARLGNPREVVLKVTEALQVQDLDSAEDEDEDKQNTEEKSATGEPTAVDRFCTLVNLLSILHPRIKTKYPSRFLSTSLMAILSAFRPSNQATLAVISFVHIISGKKRPPLPGRKSSLKIPVLQSGADSNPSAPDPEAQEEDPHEAAIQTKLLQSFVTHILEEYVNANPLEWSARLLESFEPGKVVIGRTSLGEAFKQDPALQTRDTIVGQLVVSFFAMSVGLLDVN